jgi:hypothetical protein
LDVHRIDPSSSLPLHCTHDPAPYITGAGEGVVREAFEGAERVRVVVVAGRWVWSSVERVERQGRCGRCWGRGACAERVGAAREALGSVLGAHMRKGVERVGAVRKASGLGLRAHVWRGLGQRGRRWGWGSGA